MWVFTLVHTLFSLSYNPILYYNAVCRHRRGSVHGHSDSSVGWSVCHDRGTQLGTRNRVLDGRSRSPMRMGNFEGRKGRPIGRSPSDDISTSGQHIWMFHEHPCFICFVVWPTTSKYKIPMNNIFMFTFYPKFPTCVLCSLIGYCITTIN